MYRFVLFRFIQGAALGLIGHVTELNPGRGEAHDQLQETEPVREQHPIGGQVFPGQPVEPRGASTEPELRGGHLGHQSELSA